MQYLDGRTGIGIDPDSLTCAKSLLYGIHLLRIKPQVETRRRLERQGVADPYAHAEIVMYGEVLVAEPDEAEVTARVDGALPFGGEGKYAHVTRTAVPVCWPTGATTSKKPRPFWLLATPGLFQTQPDRPAWIPDLLEADLLRGAACGGRIAVSGWDIPANVLKRNQVPWLKPRKDRSEEGLRAKADTTLRVDVLFGPPKEGATSLPASWDSWMRGSWPSQRGLCEASLSYGAELNRTSQGYDQGRKITVIVIPNILDSPRLQIPTGSSLRPDCLSRQQNLSFPQADGLILSGVMPNWLASFLTLAAKACRWVAIQYPDYNPTSGCLGLVNAPHIAVVVRCREGEPGVGAVVSWSEEQRKCWLLQKPEQPSEPPIQYANAARDRYYLRHFRIMDLEGRLDCRRLGGVRLPNLAIECGLVVGGQGPIWPYAALTCRAEKEGWPWFAAFNVITPPPRGVVVWTSTNDPAIGSQIPPPEEPLDAVLLGNAPDHAEFGVSARRLGWRWQSLARRARARAPLCHSINMRLQPYQISNEDLSSRIYRMCVEALGIPAAWDHLRQVLAEVDAQRTATEQMTLANKIGDNRTFTGVREGVTGGDNGCLAEEEKRSNGPRNQSDCVLAQCPALTAYGDWRFEPLAVERARELVRGALCRRWDIRLRRNS